MYSGAVGGTIFLISIENGRRDLNWFTDGKIQSEPHTVSEAMSRTTAVTALNGRRFRMKVTVKIPPTDKTNATGRLIQNVSSRTVQANMGSPKPMIATATKKDWLNHRQSALSEIRLSAKSTMWLP